MAAEPRSRNQRHHFRPPEKWRAGRAGSRSREGTSARLQDGARGRSGIQPGRDGGVATGAQPSAAALPLRGHGGREAGAGRVAPGKVCGGAGGHAAGPESPGQQARLGGDQRVLPQGGLPQGHAAGREADHALREGAGQSAAGPGARAHHGPRARARHPHSAPAVPRALRRPDARPAAGRGPGRRRPDGREEERGRQGSGPQAGRREAVGRRAGPGPPAPAAAAGEAGGGDAGPGPQPQDQPAGRPERHQDGQPDPVALPEDGRPEPGEAEDGVGAAGAARAEVGQLAAVGRAGGGLLRLHRHDPLHPHRAQAQVTRAARGSRPGGLPAGGALGPGQQWRAADRASCCVAGPTGQLASPPPAESHSEREPCGFEPRTSVPLSLCPSLLHVPQAPQQPLQRLRLSLASVRRVCGLPRLLEARPVPVPGEAAPGPCLPLPLPLPLRLS